MFLIKILLESVLTALFILYYYLIIPCFFNLCQLCEFRFVFYLFQLYPSFISYIINQQNNNFILM